MVKGLFHMKLKLFALLTIVAVSLVFWTFDSAAQDPVPSAGEENLVVLACQIATVKAKREGLEMVWCRRAEPDVIDGNWAHVRVDIKIVDYGVFETTTDFFKSPWAIEFWGATPK